MQKYSVRESKRAKHVSLKMSVRDGLVVVVPYGFDPCQIPDILRRKHSWVENAYRRIEKQRNSKPESSNSLPRRICLQAINEEISIEYKPIVADWVQIMKNGNGNILISGAVDNYSLCKAVLQKWTNYKAKKHLLPWLKKVSEEMELPFNHSTVRNQRSRWGSCSQQKNISINQKMLFFPKHLVRYVFIHELCHTVYLNHSSAFWALLRQREPKYKEYRKELRTAGQYVPTWHESI